MASKLSNDFPRRHIPIKDLSVTTARTQFRVVRGDMNVTYFAAMGLVGLDVDAAVWVPESDGAVFPGAEAVIAVTIEPRC